MPAYTLHRLTHPGGDPDPAVRVFFDDQAAMRWALSEDFAAGCDVWEGTRYVGRVHRPAASADPPTVILGSNA